MSQGDLLAVLQAYTRTAEECRLPKMKLSRCEISSQFLSSVDQVWAILAPISAPVGWLGFQSGNMALDGLAPAGATPTLGVLMDAELAVKEKSIHVRYRGDGWIVTTYTPGMGEEFLSDEVTMLTSNGSLAYERLWSLDPHVGIRQAHARLVAKEIGQ